MTLVALGKEERWPGHTVGITASAVFSGMNTIDGSGDQCTYILEARENMVVDRIGFRPNTVTSSPTAIVCIETVVGNVASGTLFDTSNGGSTGTTGVLSTSSMNITTLAQPATISKGQRFAVVIRWNSVGSFVTSSIARPTYDGQTNYPFKVTNVSGSNVRSAMGLHPVILGSSSTNFYRINGFIPVTSFTSVSIANNVAVRAACLKFKFVTKNRIIGVRLLQSNASIADDYTVSIQDGATSGAADVGSTALSVDADNSFISGGLGVEHLFTNPFTPELDTWYRMVFQGDATGDSAMNYAVLENANHAKAIGAGIYTQMGTRDSGGTWTDYDTRIPFVDLILDQGDNGVGTGGGTTYSALGAF